MPDKLKHSTRGANQNHNRRSDGKIRPSRRLVPPFRPQNQPHADFSFNPTDFLVQGNRLLTIPTDFFFSAYGVIRTNHTAPDSPDFRIFAAFATAPDDVPNKFIDEYFKHKNVTEFQSREMFAIDFTNAAKLCGQAEDETPPF